jgi:hypothetical protein
MEPLEPRLLLSADALVPFAVGMADDANDLTLQLDYLTQTLQAVSNNTSAIVAEQDLDRTSQVVITGSDGDDRFTVAAALSSSIAISFEGGAGSDTLVGRDVDSVWQLTGAGEGHVGGIQFTNVENLEGGAAADTLAGTSDDTTWSVTGADSGSVLGVAFSGVENLQGAAGNEDTFVFEDGGSLSGIIAGGDAGFDTLDIRFSAVDTMIYEATGPDSGSVDSDGNVIGFVGLEPVTQSGAANLIVTMDTGATADDVTLELDPLDSTKLALTTGGTAEAMNFAPPGTSLTVRLGLGNDTLTIGNVGACDLDKLTVEGQGGTDEVVATVTGGTDFELSNGTLKIGTDSISLDSIEEADLTGGSG